MKIKKYKHHNNITFSKEQKERRGQGDTLAICVLMASIAIPGMDDYVHAVDYLALQPKMFVNVQKNFFKKNEKEIIELTMLCFF